jgi:starch synthase
MKIYYTSSEAYPFSKSGGLADVAAALPKTLHNHGHDLKVFIPFYKQNMANINEFIKLGDASITINKSSYKATFYQSTLHDVPYILIYNKQLFDRQNYYGHEDDALRFTFFNHAILTYINNFDDFPDVLHLNDWQTSLIPFLLDTHYIKLNPRFKSIKTLLTIHNLEKQGSFPLENEVLLDNTNFTYIHLDKLNFLKTGIMRAHAINTVSESYKQEILTRFYGFNLQGPLKSRQYQLFGILNGFDETIYNPVTSPYLTQNYNEDTFEVGKKYNKKAILEKFGFEVDLNKPMIAFINRFARQKGIDLLMHVLDEYLENDAFYLVIMGKGDPLYATYFESLSKKYPKLVYFQNSYEMQLSHQVYAASDLFLLPSLFEPCGLNQMIAMKFGALPIVRETGGLKDTVTPYNKFTGVGVGFAFKNNDDEELKETMDQAIALYHDENIKFTDMIHQAMHVHHSMDKMAQQYETLYAKLINNEI